VTTASPRTSTNIELPGSDSRTITSPDAYNSRRALSTSSSRCASLRSEKISPATVGAPLILTPRVDRDDHETVGEGTREQQRVERVDLDRDADRQSSEGNQRGRGGGDRA
jgi:hypothetical protein